MGTSAYIAHAHALFFCSSIVKRIGDAHQVFDRYRLVRCERPFMLGTGQVTVRAFSWHRRCARCTRGWPSRFYCASVWHDTLGTVTAAAAGVILFFFYFSFFFLFAAQTSEPIFSHCHIFRIIIFPLRLRNALSSCVTRRVCIWSRLVIALSFFLMHGTKHTQQIYILCIYNCYTCINSFWFQRKYRCGKPAELRKAIVSSYKFSNGISLGDTN